MAAPTIVGIYPLDGATAIGLTETIQITFDQEIDPTSLKILVEGPDANRWSGPDQVVWDDPTTSADDYEVLVSAGFKGMVEGVLTFEKVDESGNSYSGMDYSGGGTSWRTKVIFTPTVPLARNTQYTIYIVGQEEGSNQDIGVSSRTVFDTVKGSNLGIDGAVIFSGGYTGPAANTLHVQIKQDGTAKDRVRFEWWYASAPGVHRELQTREKSQLLTDGVYIKFADDFVAGDTFSVTLKPVSRMQETYSWGFTTTSEAYAEVPEGLQASTPIDGIPPSTVEVPAGIVSSFTIIETDPVIRGTNLKTSTIHTIKIKFNKNIDLSKFDPTKIKVWSEPVNGVFTGNPIQYTGDMVVVTTAEDDTITIQLN